MTGTAGSGAGATAGVGQVLTPDGGVQSFDPRELLACWADLIDGSMEIGTEWPSA